MKTEPAAVAEEKALAPPAAPPAVAAVAVAPAKTDVVKLEEEDIQYPGPNGKRFAREYRGPSWSESFFSRRISCAQE